MRIVHLSSASLRGGAGRSALRLHRGLRGMGQDSRLLVDPGDRDALEEGVEVVSAPEGAGVWTAGVIQRDCIRRRRTPLSNTFFSFGYPGRDLVLEPAVRDADIIHLHWVSGLLSIPGIVSLLETGKPLVWTLHDQRPFTGGCHFSADCRGFEATCAACPQLHEDTSALPSANLADEILLLSSRGIHVVCPSHWLADCARNSAVFAGGDVRIIPYGIETEIFAPVDKMKARAALGLPSGGFHLLFGADYGAEKRKGFQELSAALRLCLEDPEFARRIQEDSITTSYFGRPSEAIARLGFSVHAHGHIPSDERMALLYAAASVYVLPSLEDNLPNTLLECMSAGTPAVAFNVGGIPDLLKNAESGYLVAPGDSRALAEAILKASKGPDLLALMAVACRKTIEESHTLQIQAGRYLQLYEELWESRAPMIDAAPSVPVFGPAIRRLVPSLILRSMKERAIHRIRSLPLVGRFA